jgi:agmatinase
MIEAFEARVLSDGKLPVMLGGEHLVTLGALRAAAAKYRGCIFCISTRTRI